MPPGNNQSFGKNLGMTAASAAIGTLGDIGISLINNNFMKKQYEREVAQEQRTYDRNRKDYLADLASERSYNSPSQQLSRIREAGLNPNLMSEGTLSSGISSSAQVMGNGSMTGLSPTHVNNGLGSGMIAMSTADVARSRADAQNASDYAHANHQTQLAASEAEYRPIKKALIKAQIAKEEGQASVYNHEVKKLLEETGKLAIEKNNAQDIATATINQIKSQSDYYTAESQLAAQKKLTEAYVTDYKKVEKDWAKVNQWINVITSVMSSAGQIMQGVTGWKIATRMASKALDSSDRGKFIGTMDDIIQQCVPPSNGGTRQNYMDNDWSSMAPGL